MRVSQIPEFRKPFTPPTSKTPVLVRTISYGGEPHPADRKAAIVVSLSKLPLKDAAALHKFKLLAGVRWSIDPPKDSGISEMERNPENGDAGYFKISCEDFPEVQMNMKWCSDALDKIVKEANVSPLPHILRADHSDALSYSNEECPRCVCRHSSRSATSRRTR